MTNIKQLPEYFEGRGEVKGKTFQQLRNGKNAFIYLVGDNGRKYYEVFKKRVSRSRLGDELLILYPKSASFGSWALTTDKFPRALEMFEKYEHSKPFKVPEL
jgi:hypothetical protein